MSNLVYANYDADSNQVLDPNSTKAGAFANIKATNSVLLVGDSMCERSFSSANASSVIDNNDGTATLLFASIPHVQAIQTAQGDIIRVNNCGNPKLNQLSALVLDVNTTAKSVTYTTTGPYSPMPGSGTPWIVLERSLSILSFFSYLNQLADGELTVVSNCTQGGAALEEITQIFDAVAQPAKFGIFLGGRNNIYARTQTYAQTVAYATVLIDKMIRKCDIPVIITCPPQDRQVGAGGVTGANANTSWSVSKMQIQLQYDNWLREYGRSKNCIVVDAGNASSNGVAFRDSTSADANPANSGVIAWTPDGTHQAGISSYALGNATYAAIAPYIVRTISWPSSAAHVYANDPSIITDYAMFTGTTGTITANGSTVTGTVPTGCALTVNNAFANVTLTSPARVIATDGDSNGFNLHSVITTTGACQITLQIPLTVARLTYGDIIRGAVKFSLKSPVNVVGMNCGTRVVTSFNGNTPIIAADACSGTVVAAAALTEGYKGSLVTPWMKLRNSSQGVLSSGYVNVSVYFGGAGSATIDWAQLHSRRYVL